MNHPTLATGRFTFIVSLAVFIWCASVAIVDAQTIQPPFDTHYTVSDLGSVPGLPTNNGGLVVSRDDSDVLLIGGAANGSSGKLYAITLVRDGGGHITGFSGTATLFADAAFNDGGVIYGPGNVLLLVRYPSNQVGQTKPGSTITDKTVDLGPLGVNASPGGIVLVPAGFPGAGQLKLCSYNPSVWYTLTYAPDGTGTFDITAATNDVTLSGGVEGIAYVPPGSPEFADNDAVLVSEYLSGKVSTYALDANGNPDALTRREVLTGLTGAEGAAIDPVTGDFLFSTFGGGNRVVAIRGFVPPAPTPTATPDPCAKRRAARAAAGSPRTNSTEADSGRLGSVDLRKAAVKCQQVVTKARAKIVSGKFKALDACSNAATACVQSKAGKAGCLEKAGQLCAKKLSAAALAAEKAQAKIVTAKSCAVQLRLADLLASDGLGFGEIADQCRTNFALDVCDGLPPLAQCLVQTQDRAVGRLYGRERPRTAEVLDLLPSVLPPIAGLETFAGCGNCSSTGDKTAVEQCGKALTKAARTLFAALDTQFGSCAARVFGCVQTQADKPQCLTTARAKCGESAAKITKALEKFVTQASKKCGTDAVDFAQLASVSGLDLDALAPECAAFGLPAPSSIATLADCVQRRARCTSAELVRQSIARTDAFAVGDRLGALGTDLGSVCPDTDLGAVAKERHARGVFGSLAKFLKTVIHVGGASLSRLGTPPTPTANAPKGVSAFGGSQRVVGGFITKLPFTYRVAPRSRATDGAALVSAPKLIVAVLAEGATSEDYFEVTLDPPAGQTEVNDEIELEYQDTLPGCVFTLTFAIDDGGVVSDYTPLPVVVDPDLDPCA